MIAEIQLGVRERSKKHEGKKEAPNACRKVSARTAHREGAWFITSTLKGEPKMPTWKDMVL